MEWDDARCAQCDVFREKKEDVFFVDECNKEDIIKIDQAKQYCGECAVRDICLSFALKEGART